MDEYGQATIDDPDKGKASWRGNDERIIWTWKKLIKCYISVKTLLGLSRLYLTPSERFNVWVQDQGL